MKGQKFFPLLLVAAGLLAYQDSFTGALLRDDGESILDNPSIRHLWPIWQALSPPHRGGATVEGRPLINLSLAVNYALGGYNVWGYHVLNLAVHVLAGLTLFGIVRRTLLTPTLVSRFGAAASELALATAVLWMVHPLQTESVTYIIQRAESIMGLWYLLTLYCFIRGVESPHAEDGKWMMGNSSCRPHSRLWYGLSVTACALGMASKEVMVSAPVIVMLYDRAFVSGSFREACRQRWPLYLALASTWILLGLLAASAGRYRFSLAEAQRHGITRWEYLATQPGVILYYLRLSVWPSPLSLGHPWPIARTWTSILPPTVVVVVLLVMSTWALIGKTGPALPRRPVWGFLGAWFFLILGPSSSFVPFLDPLYEHRMYLSLAAVVSLVAMGLYWVAGRRSLTVLAVAAIGLGFLTWRRNQDYRSEIAMRFAAVSQRPTEPMEHYNLGIALAKAGRVQEAISQYQQTLQLNPTIDGVRNNLGVALEREGRVQEAVACYEQAVRLTPDDAEAHNNLGSALARLGRVPEAIVHWERAVHLRPDYAEAHYNWGVALARLNRLPEAMEHWEKAVHIKPDYADAHNNLGAGLLRLGKVQDAIGQFEEVLRLKPDLAAAHYNLAVALEQAGRIPEAIEQYEQVLRLKPDYAAAQDGLTRLRAVGK